jgi:N-acetylglucosamine-6-phosphate deacetylase
MAEALRRAVADCGLTLEQAAVTASANPARVLGLQSAMGSIDPGQRANLVVLGDDLQVIAVMADGRWCEQQ